MQGISKSTASAFLLVFSILAPLVLCLPAAGPTAGADVPTSGCAPCGDITRDWRPTAEDALLAFRHCPAVAAPPLTQHRTGQADVTGDGVVTPPRLVASPWRAAAIAPCPSLFAGRTARARLPSECVRTLQARQA